MIYTLRQLFIQFLSLNKSISSLSIVFVLIIAFVFSGYLALGQCTLVAHYPLDGNAGDSSAFSNHGTIYGSPTGALDRFNQPNGAMTFDGVDDYINTFSTFDYQERTVSFWFRPEEVISSSSVLIQDANTLSFGAISARLLNGDIYGRAGNASGSVLYSNATIGQWFHMVLVRRTDSAICYVNGVKASAVVSGSGGSFSGAYDKLVIGTGRTRNVSFFDGQIDDIKIFSCELDAIQIDSLFNDSSAYQGLGPNCQVLGSWPFDGNALDTSQYQNHGSTFGGPTLTTDRFNQPNSAYHFDGQDDYINTLATYDVPFRTVSFWFYPERNTGSNSILIQDANTLSYGAFSTRINNGQLLGRASGTSRQILSSITLNQWYHLTMVSRPDSGFYYLDGNLVAAEASLPGGSSSAAYDKLVFGVGRQRNQNFFQGKLDDVLIVGCNFSAQQVDSLHIAQSPSPPLDSLPNDTVICNGDSLVIQLLNHPNVSHLWGDGSTSSGRVIHSSGVYTLRSTNLTDTLLDTISISFVNPYIPALTDTTICDGNSLTVDYRTFTLDSLVWSDGDRSYVRTFSSAQSLGLTAYNACGSFSDSLNITFQSTLEGLSWDTLVCSIPLEIGFRLDSTLNYSWSTGENTRTINATNTGLYTIQISNACDTVVDTVIVRLPQAIPNIMVADSSFICSEGDSILIGNPLANGLNFNWSNNTQTDQQWVREEGQYTLEVYNDCDSLSFTYNIYKFSDFKPSPLADTTFCRGSNIFLDLNEPFVSSIQVNGETLDEGLLDINAAGFYIINYKQACGSWRDTIVVTESACTCDFAMADAFTPNGDGLNDRFIIKNECENFQFSMQIYNRLGTLIFESNGPNDYWDGSYQGKAASGGAYIYKLWYEGSINSEPYTGYKQGTLTLIR